MLSAPNFEGACGGNLKLTLTWRYVTGHHETALNMIAAGKHVMVEKCFAMNEGEAAEMIDAARKQVRLASAITQSNACAIETHLSTLLRSFRVQDPYTQ